MRTRLHGPTGSGRSADRGSTRTSSRTHRRWRFTVGVAVTAVVVGALGALSPASAVLAATGVGPIDPVTGFPSSYTDTNGVSLQPCLDGLPICSGTTADLMDPAGGGEGFYFSADATVTAGPVIRYHSGLEAAWFAPADPTVNNRETFVRTQISVPKGGLAANATYTVTDPWGTLTCVSDANGSLLNTAKGCRFQTAAAAGDFTSALPGRLSPTGPGGTGTAAGPGPFLTWDPAVSAPPAGYIGDFVTPHKVIGSPTGFNSFRIAGPNITSTCAGGTIPNCAETDQFVLQGKVQPGASAAISASSWDFGNVPATKPVTKSFTYTNTSSDGTAVDVTGVATSAATSSDYTVGGTCAAGPLAPGASCTVDVTYAPTGTSPDTGSVTISSDTPTIGNRTISLTGTSIGVPVVHTPATGAALAFGNQATGSSSPESIIVVGNSGVADVSLSSRTLTGTGSSHFSLGTTNTCAAGVSPGGGCEVGVLFSPTTTGPKDANVRLAFSDGTILNVPLTGAGVAPKPDTTAPTAPVLTATRTGTTANLSWSGATDNVGVTGYRILRGGVQIATTTTATTFNDAALVPGTYAYTVKAVDAAGNLSVASNSQSVTVAAPVPAAPTGVTVTRGNAGATVRWVAPTTGPAVTGYQVEVRTGGALVGALRTAAATARTLAVTGLTNGTTYSVRVRATSAAGPGTYSAAVTVTPATTPGTPVIGTAVAGVTGGTITATAKWSAPAVNGGSAITGYKVRALRMSSTGTVLATTVSAVQPATARSLQMTLPVTGRYRFTVWAVNSVGAGTQSARSNLVAGR